MTLRSIVISLVLAAPAVAQTAQKAAAPASAPTKVAIIQFQDAVLSTQEGKQAQASLKSRFDPQKTQLEKKQADLKAMQAKLQSGGATLSPEARTKLQNDIAAGGRALNHEAEDLNTAVQEAQGKVMQTMAAKMGELIKSYATKNGYTVVLDVSSAQTPVIWASPSVNITADIVKLYDQAHPLQGGAAPAAKKQ